MKWRKWNRIIHRDFGYLFFGMTIIYSISGIAVNHISDWNPSYNIEQKQYSIELSDNQKTFTKTEALEILNSIGEKADYKKHYMPNNNSIKIFIKNGSLTIDTKTGTAVLEKITRKPILHQVNYLHYNPGKWWTYFSDLFALSLIIIAVSGLLIIKGKKGITGRGAWLTGIGILVPILFLILFY
ncbi:MAG: PepSY-associated TM helix domain-containing protein [Melioribacteraceae bacterium]|nr:PepSY-associated TM helix domain-containing protein [Melioribacteraceae bacterium]